MANTIAAFARLYTSIPSHRHDDGTQASGEEILRHYRLMEYESQSDLFTNPTLLPILSKVSETQLDYDRGYGLIKQIGIKLDELYRLKYH